jgi:hypothetical protein
LRGEYTRTFEPARAFAAKTLKLQRTLSGLVNQAYALTPAEIDLIWKTAPPRMPKPAARVIEASEAPEPYSGRGTRWRAILRNSVSRNSIACSTAVL